MPAFDPEPVEMPRPDERCTEREELSARVAAATSFSQKYPGVYERLQESFDIWRTIEANMLRLDRIGPRLFDRAVAIQRSRAFVEGLEFEMRQIEALNATFKPDDLPPLPDVIAARRSAAQEQRMADREAAANLAPPAPADGETADGPELHIGQYL